jgi:hypothetical protein
MGYRRPVPITYNIPTLVRITARVCCKNITAGLLLFIIGSSTSTSRRGPGEFFLFLGFGPWVAYSCPCASVGTREPPHSPPLLFKK